MTPTPTVLWLLRLLPLFWFTMILLADSSAATETARTLINDAGLPPGGHWVQLAAQNARTAVVTLAADYPDTETFGQIASFLFPENWLLSRIDAAEALVLIFLIRMTSGLRLLGVTFLFWLAALYDGLVCRRVAYLTFMPYRPILAMNAGAATVLLPVVMLTVLASPWLQAEAAALVIGLLAGGAVNLWARSFHRFGP